MGDSQTVTLNLWPAERIPQSADRELRRLGVNAERLQACNGRISLFRTCDGQIGLRITLWGCQCGLTDLQAVLATLRLTRIHYVVYDGDGDGQSYDAASGQELQLATRFDGAPVMTVSRAETLQPHALTIAVYDDDLFAETGGC